MAGTTGAFTIRLQAHADVVGGVADGRKINFHLGAIRLSLLPDSAEPDDETPIGAMISAVVVPSALSDDVRGHLETWWNRPPSVRVQNAKALRGIMTPEQLESVLGWFQAPEEVLAYFEPHVVELRAGASRLVQLLRWRFNLMRPERPLTDERVTWSFDSERWGPGPTRLPDPPFFGEWIMPALTDRGLEALQAWFDDGTVGEPLARQLLLEAVALREVNPRAAVVLAVTAAEVGLDHYEADSLSKPEGSSVGFLGARLTAIRAPDSRGVPVAMQQRLRRAVGMRNAIVHGGAAGPDETELAALLSSMNDYLYMLDWFAGSLWALGHISHEVRVAWMNRPAS